LDCDIILAIDFDLYNIDYIQFEGGHCDGPHANGGSKYDSIIKLLISHGFKIQNIPHHDTIAIKNHLDWKDFVDELKVIVL